MYSHDSTAPVACKTWHPDTTSGTYLPPNTREASYAISPIVGLGHPRLFQIFLQCGFFLVFTARVVLIYVMHALYGRSKIRQVDLRFCTCV